jgi:D-alanyl-D-alanine carboxypeptidase/D-alanyl-D-alanine-endopeptidase (penicillin-binding protein 4)
MLQAAWQSPVMPELVSSLPIAGVDGTLRRSKSRAGTAPTSKPAACAT